MRTISITRQKSFVGVLIPFYVCFDADETTLIHDYRAKNLQNRPVPIKNGQTISVELSAGEHSVIILAATSTGVVISNSCAIEADGDAHFQISNQYSFMRGSNLMLERV